MCSLVPPKWSVTVVTGLVTLPVSAPTLMDKMVGEVEDVVVEVVGIEEDETETLTLREVRSAISATKLVTLPASALRTMKVDAAEVAEEVVAAGLSATGVTA